MRKRTMTSIEGPARTSFQVMTRLLRNFWFNLLFMIMGLFIGGFFEEWGKALYPFGHLYLSFLSMCILPIVLTAIATGLGELIRQGNTGHLIKRIVLIYAFFVLLGTSIGVFAGWLTQPGKALDSTERKALGGMMLQVDLPHPKETPHESEILSIVKKAVPNNVIKALAEDEMLAVVFVSILIGVALGVSKSEETLRVLEFMKGILEIFKRILGWVLYALPFALFCLSASLIATSGWSVLAALSRTLFVIYACCAVMCLLYLLTIRLTTPYSFAHILRVLRDALALAFFSNSLVAMPTAMRKLQEGLHLSDTGVRLVLPLGVVMNRHIYPLLFAFMAVLSIQVYGYPLSMGHIFHIVLSSGLLGMAAVGNLAVVAPLIQQVLQPLGLPAGIAIVILIESTAIVNPVVKMTQLFGACATTSVICKGHERKGSLHSGEKVHAE